MRKERKATQKQVWLDVNFADKLEKLQAKKRLIGEKVSLGELTKELISLELWNDLENEVLKKDRQITRMGLKIKFDGNFN